jgi:hypothetical protein
MNNRYFAIIAMMLSILIAPSSLLAQEVDENSWPREIETQNYDVVIYQPQPERLEGDRLYGRAAVALESKTGSEPIFGAIWLNARLLTDHADRTATFDDIKVSRVRFPNQNAAKEKELTTLLEAELPKNQMPIDLDNLIATLEIVQEREETAKNLKIDPPRVLFVKEPAVLISIDGKPEIRDEDGIPRVINTPYTILQDPKSKRWYLSADVDKWYSASDITGEWQLAKSVPKKIAALQPEPPPADPEAEQADREGDVDDKFGPAPKVIVVTEPTELISSSGKPKFTSISGTDLLYVSNTDSDVLLDIKKQEYYLLLSGRWYASKSIEGPWRYIAGDQLPSDFSKIPEHSDMASVRYAVPGTEEAEEAVLDAQMPQTAVIDRRKASLTVKYDGEPKFEPIEDTKLLYAVNTATPVILADGRYYAVDEAVWFVADKPTGKWVVAIEVPGEIYTIPIDSPLYHVTFVRVYSYTPEIVYVGYTQGYTHVYVYHGTIVYGTGYWYPGWYGHYYYPRPSTWGFHVRYNPRWGWSFGLSYSTGPFTFYIGHGGWYRGGWWGPSRYRSYRRGFRHGRRAGFRAGYRAGKRGSARDNIYRTQRNQNRTRPGNKNTRPNKSQPSTRRGNNVYADRKGDVHRNTDQGWEKRTDKGWSKDRSRDKPQQKKQTTRKNTQRSGSKSNLQQLNRSNKSRQTGNSRAKKRRWR